jgi:Imm-5 like putative immunity protein
VGSPQTLSEADRRTVAVWGADCAERVLGLFEAEAPRDSRPRDAIARLGDARKGAEERGLVYASSTIRTVPPRG